MARGDWISWRQAWMECDELTFNERAVLFCLHTYMNDADMSATPGQETIASKMKCGKRSVIKWLLSIEEKGWISSRQRYHSSNIYTASYPVDNLSQSAPDAHSLKSQSAPHDKSKCISRQVKVHEVHTNNQVNIQRRLKEKVNQKEKSAKRFTPPSVEDVREYVTKKNLSIDSEHFVDYYTANGWNVGKNAMKDWQATARNWSRNNALPGNSTNPNQPPNRRQSAAERNQEFFETCQAVATGNRKIGGGIRHIASAIPASLGKRLSESDDD